MISKLLVFKKSFIFIFLFLINLLFFLAYNSLSVLSTTSKVGVVSRGEKLFKTNCLGCHLNGKNLIKAEKPIIGSQKLRSILAFKDFISSPPAPMPKFKNIAQKPDQLEALYKHVTSLMGK